MTDTSAQARPVSPISVLRGTLQEYQLGFGIYKVRGLKII